MWPWLRHWLDWAMHDLWPMHRLGSRPQLLHYSYEKAGLTLANQPIPWNAEAVLVEALMLRLPEGRSRVDFHLVLPERPPLQAEHLRREENGTYRLFFRLPPPVQTTTAELHFRSRKLGELTLPILTRDAFIASLRVPMASVYVRLGEQSVACQTFVASQCQGLLAGALLTCPTSLVPLQDLNLRVEFRSERKGLLATVPATLTSSQLAGRQALVSLAPKRWPRHSGSWSATWLAEDFPLCVQRFRGVTLGHFHRSLRISDTRFLIKSAQRGLLVDRQLPPLDDHDRVGPCFLVASREAGMAGLCQLSVHALVRGAIQPPVLQDQPVLITDGPAVVAPGTLDRADLAEVTGFELRLKKKVLGMLSLRSSTAALFTSEGGFKPPEEYLWTAAAEDELNQRLGKLLGGAKLE